MGGTPKAPKRGPTSAVLAEAADLGQSRVLRSAQALEREHPTEARSVKEHIARVRESLGLGGRVSEGGHGVSEVLQQAAEPSSAHPAEPAMVLGGDPVPVSMRNPAAEKRRNRRLSNGAEAPRESIVPEDVAPRALRRALRDSLEAKLELIKVEMEVARKERDRALERIRALNRERASPTTTALETPQKRRQRIEAELEAAREELHSADVGRDLGAEYIQTLRLLDATERDYYLALTAAASKTEAYQMVAKNSTASWGGGSGALAVDHVFPRSKIFLLAGFEKLPWDVQVEMFAYSKNLRLIDAVANSSRGATPYAKLSAEFRERFSLTTQKQTELAALEDDMERYFTKWVETRRQPMR